MELSSESDLDISNSDSDSEDDLVGIDLSEDGLACNNSNEDGLASTNLIEDNLETMDDVSVTSGKELPVTTTASHGSERGGRGHGRGGRGGRGGKGRGRGGKQAEVEQPYSQISNKEKPNQKTSVPRTFSLLPFTPK